MAKGPIGIIGAMESEITYLVERMEKTETVEALQTVFHRGTIDGVDCVVVRCGIAKVNAALCTQFLVDRFGISAVVNTGVAGAISPKLDVMDIVVSTDAVHHDIDLSPLGFAPGSIVGMPVDAFPADPTLRDTAMEAAESLLGTDLATLLGYTPEEMEAAKAGMGIDPDDPDAGNPKSFAFAGIECGRVASGEQFISSHERKAWIAETFDALCCEMEGAAIAHAAYLNDVPSSSSARSPTTRMALRAFRIRCSRKPRRGSARPS
ncbi:MAG: 5'-methylthioadenosine/adenosylhomocysteine nucleosidase [Atopobiaceae bacterium]|nr:5'-methylthioadenosine/adenosylhomocysteine nucleosidase [Atopobiaceae bacterium]